MKMSAAESAIAGMSPRRLGRQGGSAIDSAKTRFLRFSVLLLAVAVLVAGIFDREYQAVFRKATRICLECIGIG